MVASMSARTCDSSTSEPSSSGSASLSSFSTSYVSPSCLVSGCACRPPTRPIEEVYRAIENLRRPGANARITAYDHAGDPPALPVYNPNTHVLRKNLYRQAINFSKKGEGSCYDVFLSGLCPTDPMMMYMPPEPSSLVKADIANTKPPRPRWSGLVPLFFVLVCDGIQSGIVYSASVHHFYDLRAAFYLKCMLFWVIAAIPLIQLQHALSQFFQGGPLRSCALLHPRLRGIGISMILLLFVRAPYQVRAVGQSLLYLIASAQSRIPWKVPSHVSQMCAQRWGSTNGIQAGGTDCLDILTNGSWVPDALKPMEAYNIDTLLGSPSGGSVSFNLEIAAACFICLCIVFIITLAGLKLFGRIATFTVITFFLLLTTTTLIALNVGGGREAFSLFIQNSFTDFMSTGSWLYASFLTCRMSAVISGQHCVMLSYTRVGTNALYVSWMVGFFSLLVSTWIVSLIHVFQGSFFTSTARATFMAIYGTSDLQPARLVSLVEEKVEEALASPQFRTFVLSGIEKHSNYEFAYVLYPFATGTFEAGPLLLIIFYLCLTLAGIVAIASTCFVLVSAFQEMALFEKSSSVLLKGFVFFVLFLSTLPLFFFAVAPLYPKPDSLIYIIYYITVASFRVGVPLVGVCYIIGTLMALGYSKQRDYISKYCIALYWFLTIGGLCFFLIFLQSTVLYYRTFVAGGVAFFTIVGVPVVLAALGRRTYKSNVWALLLGDVEPVRALINTVMFGHNCRFRLRRSWSIALKYGCIAWFLLLIVSVKSIPCFNQRYASVYMDTKYVLISYLAVIIFVTTPIFFFSLFPNVANVMDPSSHNSWKMTDIVNKTGPRRGLQHISLKFWEEFFSPQALWVSADNIAVRKL